MINKNQVFAHTMINELLVNYDNIIYDKTTISWRFVCIEYCLGIMAYYCFPNKLIMIENTYLYFQTFFKSAFLLQDSVHDWIWLVCSNKRPNTCIKLKFIL